MGHLVGEFGRFRLALPRVLAAGSLAGAFATAARARQVHARIMEATPSPVLWIRGGWDAYQASQSPQTVRETRRKIKRLENAGRAERLIVTGKEGWTGS